MISRILCAFGFHKGIYDLGTEWTETLTSEKGTVTVTRYLKQKRVCIECRIIEFQKVEVSKSVTPAWADPEEEDQDE